MCRGKGSVPFDGVHPRPAVYRRLLYAMAWWLDEQDLQRTKWIVEANGSKLDISSVFDDEDTRKEQRNARRRDRAVGASTRYQDIKARRSAMG